MSSAPPPNGTPPSGDLQMTWNPAAVIAFVIVMSVILLIGVAVLGWDNGDVVSRMSQPDFARGIIAYLLAVTTIGVAVIVGLSGLMGSSKEQFDRGKDVLALLLGVFGTVIGFYFGSATVADVSVMPLNVSPPLFSETTVQPGAMFTVAAFVQGGVPPFQYTITLDDDKPLATGVVGTDGWLRATVSVPSSRIKDELLTVKVKLIDSSQKTASSVAQIAVAP